MEGGERPEVRTGAEPLPAPVTTITRTSGFFSASASWSK